MMSPPAINHLMVATEWRYRPHVRAILENVLHGMSKEPSCGCFEPASSCPCRFRALTGHQTLRAVLQAGPRRLTGLLRRGRQTRRSAAEVRGLIAELRSKRFGRTVTARAAADECIAALERVLAEPARTKLERAGRRATT